MKESYSLLFRIVCLSALVFLIGCGGEKPLVLADSSISWWMAPTIIANADSLNESMHEDFYERQGLTVKTFDMQTGLASLNAVLSGTADLGIVAATPLAAAAYDDIEDPIVLCSFVESSHLLSFLMRKDSLITDSSACDSCQLPKGHIAIIPRTISDWYFRLYAEACTLGVRNTLAVDPIGVGNALINENANAGVLWEPLATQFIAENSDRFVQSTVDTLYELRIFLITRKDILENRRGEVLRFVKALQAASRYLELDENQDRCKTFLRNKYGGLQSTSIKKYWDKVDFATKFDYEAMKKLILDDAELLHKTDSVKYPRLNEGLIKHFFKKDIAKEFYSAR